MNKHTPGPWAPACKANGATCRHPAILCDNGQVGNATWQGSEELTNANARLIAAAPDLLEALKLAAGINPYGSVENAAARDAARAAIAKATGQQ